MWFDPRRANANGALLLAVALAVATGLTFWLALRATREWQRSTIQAAETRGNEVVTLLGVALERDMKGGQISVLLKMSDQELTRIAPYELADRFARGFARFPYLESFFVWTASGGLNGSTYVFNRADRTPPWDIDGGKDDPYPVVFRKDPPLLGSTILLARAQSVRGSRFALFETSVNGVRYQSVAHLMYDGSGPGASLVSMVGFMVNLGWVQAHYFADFIRQIQEIIGDPTLSIEILNSDGHPVADVGPPMLTVPKHIRTFPLVFADQALFSDLPQRQRASDWTARVGVASEASLAAASRGAARTLTLLGLGAFVTIVGLGLTVRAARAAADLAEVQSEFVSAVSHEMKTPLSLIKLASDTLANGRYASAAAIADYGRMMMVEVQHLTRLIDNVLCYARINDTTSEYDFESVDIGELIQESVDRFRPQLNDLGFDVQLHLPADPGLVKADHVMLGQVFDNLIDNVTKYAASGRWLGVSVIPGGRSVRIEVADHGEGVPAGDLSRVFEKFYRQKGTRHRGAGLGLAIVRRIVEDHRGTVRMSSMLGKGASVDVVLPTIDT
jgi:signal transduction histidine kinase